ncbi:hypothetical protein V6439_004556 [Vibrio parahaemolyticus]
MCTEKQAARLQWIKDKLQLHKPMRECLGCGTGPRLGYSHGEYGEDSPVLPYPHKIGQYFEAFTLYCPNCGFKVGAFMDLQAAITAWHTINMPNDAFYAERWAAQYEKQMIEREEQAEPDAQAA